MIRRKMKLMALAGLAVLLTLGLAGGAVAAQPPEMVRVLIGFDRQPGPAEQALVRGAGGTIKYTYRLIPTIAATVPGAAIEGLRANPNVTHVDLDGRVWAIDAELDNSWGVKRIGAGTVHAYNKGTGVKVAIIDSGIDYNHEDLDANYKGGYDFVNTDTDPMDDYGHGTHVAGSVAAEDNGIGVVGVAPEAALYALKVLDETGGGYWSDVIAALEWVVDNRIHIANLSLGSSVDPGDAVATAFDNTEVAGVVIVAAAGNGGNPAGRGDKIGYPAVYESVIAVGATDKNDKRASFSSTGSELELMAPGVDINSTLLGGGYGEKNGTSMASPHVAGTAALVIATGITDNDVVRQKLTDTADDLGDPERDSRYGYGLVDADEAAPAPAATGSIAGTVTNAADGIAISGATVSVDTGQSATTATDGTYTITGVPTGDRSVTASADGFVSETKTDISVTVDTTTTVNFALAATPTGTIVGKVTESDGGTAISSATVVVEGTSLSATTAADGTYTITGVPTGDRSVTASADGFESQTKPATVIESDTTTVDFALNPVTTATTVTVKSITYATEGGKGGLKHLLITVAIVDDLENPVSGASVSIDLYRDGSLDARGTGTTGTDGTVTFSRKNAKSGTYTTTVTDVTAAGLTWDVVTPPNEFTK